MDEKQLVGEKAAEFVKEGMVIGLGTGSTVFFTLKKLGQLVKEGLSIQGIPTSKQTEKLAVELGIPLINFQDIDSIDIAIDGADEVDPEMNLIKGGGGALLREKIIAHAAKKFIVVADPSKAVNRLGQFPLPVEIIPFGFEMTIRHISSQGLSPKLRKKNGTQYITDNGNYIADCILPEEMDLKIAEQLLNMIPGVAENGLFLGMADTVVTLDKDKNILLKERS